MKFTRETSEGMIADDDMSYSQRNDKMDECKVTSFSLFPKAFFFAKEKRLYGPVGI